MGKTMLAVVGGLIGLALLGCSALPDDAKTDRMIAEELYECQLENDPNFGTGAMLLGASKSAILTLYVDFSTRDQLIAERDKECGKLK